MSNERPQPGSRYYRVWGPSIFPDELGLPTEANPRGGYKSADDAERGVGIKWDVGDNPVENVRNGRVSIGVVVR